jgi:hypothetical protein
MKQYITTGFGILLVVAFALAQPVEAQRGRGGRGANAVPSEPAPFLPDGTPDMSGLWSGGGTNNGDITRALMDGEELVMLPWAEEHMTTLRSQDDPQANCLPSGVPRGAPYPWRMVQSSTHEPASHIFILAEGNIHSYRQIFMDGRTHPDDPDPTWFGHSIGRWEDNSLVVDSVGFNDRFWFDYLGHPHTEQLHIVERYTRTDMDNMTIEVTIEDPGAYEKPFTVSGTARSQQGEIMEYICNEYNIDLQHVDAPAQLP